MIIVLSKPSLPLDTMSCILAIVYVIQQYYNLQILLIYDTHANSIYSHKLNNIVCSLQSTSDIFACAPYN